MIEKLLDALQYPPEQLVAVCWNPAKFVSEQKDRKGRALKDLRLQERGVTVQQLLCTCTVIII